MTSPKLNSLQHRFEDWGEAQDYYLKSKLTDGLPIIPPTEDRVSAMLEFAGLAPEQVIGVEEIRNKHITAEKVAINSVMAGCRPEYFPVVVSAVAACCERSFNLHASSTSTNGVTVLVSQNAKYNAATVTMRRLIQEEVYGKASFGMQMKLSWRSKGVHHSGEDDHSYLWERGIHDFDTMRFIFASDPKRMWAHSFNPSWSAYKAGAGAHAWIEFESGATCGYLCCFESHKNGSVMRVDCEGGTLELDGGKLTLKHREKDEGEEIPLDECPDSTTVILDQWNDYLNGGDEPFNSGRNNLTTVAMVEGCGVASDEGRVIDFQEYLNA